MEERGKEKRLGRGGVAVDVLSIANKGDVRVLAWRRTRGGGRQIGKPSL